MEHRGDPNHWEFSPFSVARHQDLHTAEQTVCGCLSCFKKGGKRWILGSCGEQSLLWWWQCIHVLVPHLEQVSLEWGQAPPGLVASSSDGCSRGSAFLVAPLAAPFPPPALCPGSPQLAPTASTVNPCISHLLGFRNLLPHQSER